MRNGFLRFSIRGGLALTLLVSASGIAEGCFAPPADVPVDRLITNVGAYIKDHPWEAQGFYTLARLHSLAFSYRRNKVYSYGDTLPNVDHPFHPAKGEAKPGEALTDAEAQAHLDAALKNFEQAIRLDGTKALFHNGLAYTLEAAAFSSTAPPPGVLPQPATKDETAAMEKCVLQMKSDKVAEREAGVKALSEFGAKALTLIETQMKKNDADLRAQLKSVVGALWMEKAIAEYLEAYRLAIGDDSKIGTIPLYGINSLVSYEAGHKYIELTKARGLHELEKKNVASITEGLALLGKKPMGPVTPIIFPLDSARPLADLLAPEARVHFDLDGTQRDAAWPWVKADTAILVWDPRGTGAITSGRQLFGSVTWWMFWEDGYQALDALDDNRDGVLSGDELRGLCVWRDANGNGVCDPGEVVPVQALGIESISVRATDSADGCPANVNGIRMRDGRVLPTYDWTTESVK